MSRLPTQRTASVCGLRGNAPPAETSVAARQAGSRDCVAPLASRAATRSARGSEKGLAHPIVQRLAEAASATTPDNTCFMLFPKGDGGAAFHCDFLELAIGEEGDPFPIGRKQRHELRGAR